MLNMLRMDLYRLRKSKSVYICFAIMAAIHILCYGMVFLLGTEEGRAAAEHIGMSAVAQMSEEGEALLEGQDSLMMYRSSYMDGGMYSMILGIVIAVFICTDFQGGFVKNILTQQSVRWKYIGSKLVTVGILGAAYILLGLLMNVLLNLLFGAMVPFTDIGTQAYYFAWAWLLTTAFASLVTAVCILTRSLAAGVLAAVFMSSGVIVLPLHSLTNLFGLGGWLPYTLYYNIAYGSATYSSLGDLKIFAIGLIFFVLYAAVSMISLTKQDI